MLKQVLGVHSKTSNPTICGEFARFPLSVIRKIRIIRNRYKSNRNPSWNNANVSWVILNDIVVQRIKDQYMCIWFSQLGKYAKLDTYRTLKSTFEPEKHITCLNNRCHFL